MSTETQAPDPAPLTIYISRMDAETLRSRGRCTLTAYTERVGNESNEVALTTIPAPEGAQELPPLPEPASKQIGLVPPFRRDLYTAEQMQDYARAALAAPAPQATDAELERRTGEPHVDGWPLVSGLPATLTDEMRAVLTNEKCVYGSADELYAALLAAAPQTKEPTNDR